MQIAKFYHKVRKVLHFDLRGGAPFVRAVLGKCDALTEKVE